VARRAGVSTASVTRFLRGQRVRSASAIEEAVLALDYRPSEVARSLKSGVTRSIGVVVPDVSNPFFAAVVKGAESVSRRGTYNICLCNTDENEAREHEVLAALRGRVDGLILAPVTEDAETVADLQRAEVPIVLIDRELRGSTGLDTVLVDNEGGARQAVEHLVGLGHERIGLISGPLDNTPGRGRYEGFVMALEQAGIELDEAIVQVGDFREAGGYQAALRLLAIQPPVTAIFAANNLMSIGALRALDEIGVAIPGEVSIVGFDDHALAALLAPPLTVIDRPDEEQGALAMRLLLNRLGSSTGHEPRRIVLDTALVVRGSCAPPGARTALG
jgi:LacI family transcriptional regulator